MGGSPSTEIVGPGLGLAPSSLLTRNSTRLPCYDTKAVLRSRVAAHGELTPAPAAAFSAIVDAPKRVPHSRHHLPATPFTVWQAIQRAKAAGAL